MDATLNALGGILLRAIPTLLVILLLHFYLRRMFFGPLGQVLEQRREITEGARQAADRSLKAAADKATEFEARLRDARAEIYREADQFRHKLLDQQTAALEDARTQAQAFLRAAAAELSQEAAKARLELASTSESLADQISRAILEGSQA